MWIRALGGLGIVLVLLLLCIPAWVVWHSQDLPEIDDADLLPEWVEIEPERNAFVQLETAVELLVEPERKIAPEALRGDRHALRALAPFVEANAPALAALDRALAAPDLQLPQLESAEEWSPIDCRWKQLAKLLAIRGLLRGQEDEQGLGDLLAALELSRRLETAQGGTLVDVLIGIKMRSSVLDALGTWLGRSRLDAGAAQALARRLEGYRSDPSAWARAVGSEYENLKRLALDNLERSRSGDIPGGETQSFGQLLPVRYYFHPKRTFQGFAERYRVAAENGGRLCSRLAPIPGDNPSKLRLFFSPNAGGEVLLAVGSPDFQRYHYQRCATDSHLGAVQSMAALRAWQLERGELPATLDELVPAYLEVVPEDAFDGRPLRWSPERAWLYSVGDDGSDDGGREAEAKPGDTSEPTFPLRFVGSAGSAKASPRSGERGATGASAPSA